MTTISRRQFGGLLAAGAASMALTRGAAAQGDGVSFMSFSYAEEPNKPLVQKLLDGCKAATGVSVEPIGSAWGDVQKNILLRQRSRTLPTTAQLSERWLPAMAQLPEIVNLDEAIGRDKLLAVMDPKVLAMGQVGGKTFAIPLITGSIGMIANKEVLEKAGVGVPQTIDQFRAACLAVRDKVANSVPFAAATKNPNSIPLDFMIMVWAHGGRIIDETGKVLVNSPEAKAALGLMAGMMKDRLIAPEIDRPDSRRLFAQGAAAFYIDAPQTRAFVRSFSGKGEAADAFVLPMKTPVLKAGDTPRSIQWGHLVSAFKSPAVSGADSPGVKWLAYLLSDAAQGSFPPALSALPTTKSAQAMPIVQNDPFFKAWAEATGTPLTNEIGVWSNAPELSTILSEEVQAALLGQKTADQAIGSMASRMEASMAKKG
ncbi:ABC transporter substrate-binding protein [Prosthecomicrobium sp. N25]|uniref:ABC transporter substrate-binding protein n=1 Tax=Prosthecomicrobium sp. N25 TaxID=3129254 RepID=UPI0030769F5A